MADLVHNFQLSSLVREINDSVKDLNNNDLIKNGEARVKAQEAARKLLTALETPAEAIFRHAFEVIHLSLLQYDSSSKWII